MASRLWPLDSGHEGTQRSGHRHQLAALPSPAVHHQNEGRLLVRTRANLHLVVNKGSLPCRMTLQSMHKAHDWDCKERKHMQRACRYLLMRGGGVVWGGGGVYFEGLYAADGIKGEVQAGEAGQGG